MARQTRPSRYLGAGVGAADHRHDEEWHRADPHVPRWSCTAAWHPVVLTHLGARWRDDARGIATDGPRRRSLVLYPLVCAAPVLQRQGALLRRRARFRSGARE